MLQKIVSGKYAVILFIMLCAFHIRFGVIRGWERIVSDFPNYYCSSQIIAAGKDASLLYNDSLFNKEIAKSGINVPGQFALYPPPTALLMMPLVHFTPMEAKRIWLVFNIILVFACIMLIKKILEISFLFAGNMLLLAGFCLTNDLMLGQVYLLMLFLSLLGYALVIRNRQAAGSLLWGIVMAIKYFTVIMIPVLCLKKKWKSVFYISISFLLVQACGVLLMGTKVYSYFISNIFLKHLEGRINDQAAFSIQFQSFESLFNNLFVQDTTWNPNPIYESAVLYSVCRILPALILLYFSLKLILKARNHPFFTEISASVLAVLLLLLEPGSASYHLLLLVFPIVLSARLFLTNNHQKFIEILLAILAATGFVSMVMNKAAAYYHLPLLLHYNRLWFLLIFFCFLLYSLNKTLKDQDPANG